MTGGRLMDEYREARNMSVNNEHFNIRQEKAVIIVVVCTKGPNSRNQSLYTKYTKNVLHEDTRVVQRSKQ